MEEFIDAMTGGLVWGTGFSLAMLAVRSAGGGLRPLARGTLRGAAAAGNWVRSTAEESRETLQDVYAEAQAERESAAAQPTLA
jgi:Protein of unknown function (DUF5132)